MYNYLFIRFYVCYRQSKKYVCRSIKPRDIQRKFYLQNNTVFNSAFRHNYHCYSSTSINRGNCFHLADVSIFSRKDVISSLRSFSSLKFRANSYVKYLKVKPPCSRTFYSTVLSKFCKSCTRRYITLTTPPRIH